jgi:hypothetical protein
MATGTAGSTLVGELNRLNGITNPSQFQDAQGAANTFNGSSGLGLIGALNDSAETNRSPANYKGLNAVCNELAGTTGKSAVDALRSIDL